MIYKKHSHYDYLITAILLLFSFWLQHHVYFNWDASWHIEAAKRMMNGNASYSKNLFDDNLPMVFWYFIPAVLLNHLTGIWVVTLSIASVLLSILLCVTLSDIYLREMNTSWASTAIRYALLISLLFFGSKEFAQRDMVVTTFVFPYIVLMTARMTPTINLFRYTNTLPIVIGLLTAIGLAMNPFYSLIVFALEIQRFSHTRKITLFRPELITLFIGYCLYLCIIAVIYPDYFSEIIPSYLTFSPAMNATLYHLLIQPESVFVYYATLILLLCRLNQIHHPFLSTLWISILVCFFVFLINGKLFAGHVVFLTICLTLFFVTALCQAIRHTKNASHYFIFVISTFLPLSYLTAFSYAQNKEDYRYHDNTHTSIHRLITYFNHQKSGSTFLSLTPQEIPTLPMVFYTSLHNLTPWADCWPLQAITKYDYQQMTLPQWKKQRIEKYTIVLPDKIGHILQTEKPDFILINTKKYQSYFNYRPFNLIHFYEHNALFQQNWHHYRLIKTISHYEIYERTSTLSH